MLPSHVRKRPQASLGRWRVVPPTLQRRLHHAVVEAAVLAPVVAILSPAPLFLGVGSSGDKYSMRAVQVAAGERLHLLQLSGDRTLLTASVAAGNCSACNHTSAAGAAATVAADRFFPIVEEGRTVAGRQ